MPIHKPAAEAVGFVQPGKMSEKPAKRTVVYGVNGTFQIASRPLGYHTKPHMHACEQLNYMLKGEMWLFVGDRGFHMREGDFLRIPAEAVHWAWCPTDDESTLFEWHSPPLLPKRADAHPIPLFDDDEAIRTIGDPSNMSENIFLDPEIYPADKAESVVHQTKKRRK